MMRRFLFSTVIFSLLMASLPVGSQADEPASRPATEGELMNGTCPFTGKPAASDKFVEYADEGAEVYARLYFCCENCQGKASKMDQAGLKPVYSKAYLADLAEYGEVVLVVKNDHCPVTGDPADGSTTLNYNGTQINLCCPGCAEPVIGQPDKYLHNLNNNIDEARAEKEK